MVRWCGGAVVGQSGTPRRSLRAGMHPRCRWIDGPDSLLLLLLFFFSFFFLFLSFFFALDVILLLQQNYFPLSSSLFLVLFSSHGSTPKRYLAKEAAVHDKTGLRSHAEKSIDGMQRTCERRRRRQMQIPGSNPPSPLLLLGSASAVAASRSPLPLPGRAGRQGGRDRPRRTHTALA